MYNVLYVVLLLSLIKSIKCFRIQGAKKTHVVICTIRANISSITETSSLQVWVNKIEHFWTSRFSLVKICPFMLWSA